MMSFAPDARVPLDVAPSPNHGERRVTRPDMIVLHYTGMANGDVALKRLCAPHSEVSAHYLVFEDGRCVQCVPEARRAWHAGVSFWAGVRDINSHSIGIEIANPGHASGYPDFPRKQIDAVIALCADIVRRHRIRAERILGHSDVAPQRKQDPGEKFPWRALHAAGIGHWVAPASETLRGNTLHPADSGAEVKAMQAALHQYGYGLEASGTYDATTENVVRAFQRHFRPARPDGIADPSTRATLRKLMARLPAAAQV